jgi:hypothetical protein
LPRLRQQDSGDHMTDGAICPAGPSGVFSSQLAQRISDSHDFENLDIYRSLLHISPRGCRMGAEA